MSIIRSRKFWYEAGRNYPAPWWWARLGPLVMEIHADRFGCGVVVSRWYVGVLAGPLVITLGVRKWVIKDNWTWGDRAITFTLDKVPAVKP